MADNTVTKQDSFDQWRQKHNSMCVEVGPLSSLITADKTSIVNAINSVLSLQGEDLRNNLVRAIAMS